MPTATVNGITLAYEVQGEGTPLILVHGYGTDKRKWVTQVDALSKHFKVIYFDVRSSGKSSRPDENYTMDTLVEDLKGLIDHLGLSKTHIMGQSMGGWVIQNAVLKYPNMADKLIIIGSSYKGQGIEFFKDTLIDVYELRKNDPDKGFWKFAKLLHARKFLKEMQADPKKKIHGIISTEEMIQNSMIDQITPKDLEILEQAISTHDILSRLHEIKNETLILVGAQDKLSPVLLSEEMHEKIPNSTLKIFENTGHEFFISKAPEVNQIIIDFLKD